MKNYAHISNFCTKTNLSLNCISHKAVEVPSYVTGTQTHHSGVAQLIGVKTQWPASGLKQKNRE